VHLVQIYVSWLERIYNSDIHTEDILIASANIQHSMLGIHLSQCIWHFLNHNPGPPSSIYIGTIHVIIPAPFQDSPSIPFSSALHNHLHHFSCYSISPNYIFFAHTLSPRFPTFLSPFQQKKPMPSQVRNHYSQKNQDAHFERALRLEFKKIVNLYCQSNIRLSYHLPSGIGLLRDHVPDVINEAG